MAKTTSFKLVRKPKSPKIQYRIIRKEIRQKVQPVADGAVRSFERVVANWSDASTPKFSNRVIVSPKRIEIRVFIEKFKFLPGSNKNTTADLWKWLDRTGTKPHVIKPRNPANVLAFPWGGPGSYQAKTGARPARFGGPGTVRNARPTFRKRVNHPGFPPRNFSEAIGKDLKPKFNAAVDNGYRSGFRKATQ